MIELFSIEFWIVLLFFVNFFLVIFLFLFVKKVNRLNPETPDQVHGNDALENAKQVSGSAKGIIEMLAPLVKDSRKVAIRFDEQVKEKKRLVKELNDALDERIISINLLLSRADALEKKLQENQTLVHPIVSMAGDAGLNPSSRGVLDQQNQMIEMYNQNFDIDTIAQRLSIPKGEVQLVIDLKKKIVAMENLE